MKLSDNKKVMLYTLIVVFFVMIYVVLNLLILGNTRSEEFTMEWGVSWRMIGNLVAFFTIAIGSKHLTWAIIDRIEQRKVGVKRK